MNKNTIYVCEYGWIVVGKEVERNDGGIQIIEASVVRKWFNGRGIGGLAKEIYKNEYTLDEIGNVTIQKGKILFEIPCEW